MQRIHQNTTPPDPCYPFLPCTCAIAHSRNPADFRIHCLDCHRTRAWRDFSPWPVSQLHSPVLRHGATPVGPAKKHVATAPTKLRFRILPVSWVVFADVEHLTAEAAPATAPQCSIPFQILAEVCVFWFTAH